MASPTASFVADVRRTAAAWAPAACLGAAAAWGIAAQWSARGLLEWVAFLPVGLVVLPLAFAVGLAVCALSLTVVLGALALPARCVGRPTGLAPLLADAWGLSLGIVPRYWRVVRRVRRPGLWGVALGVFVGTVAYGAARGFAT